MPTDVDFLRAILSDPDDDGPRLVYADWLDERGGRPERAEFIRVQVELAERTGGSIAETVAAGVVTTRRRIEALRRREGELLPLALSHPDWLGFDCSHVDDWQYRRGFVEHVTLTWPACRDHLDALLRVTPIRQVRLTTWPWVVGHGEAWEPSPGLLTPHRAVVHSLSSAELVSVLQEAFGPGPYLFTGELDVAWAEMRRLAMVYCHRRWPGIAFELPPAFDPCETVRSIQSRYPPLERFVR